METDNTETSAKRPIIEQKNTGTVENKIQKTEEREESALLMALTVTGMVTGAYLGNGIFNSLYPDSAYETPATIVTIALGTALFRTGALAYEKYKKSKL